MSLLYILQEPLCINAYYIHMKHILPSYPYLQRAQKDLSNTSPASEKQEEILVWIALNTGPANNL